MTLLNTNDTPPAASSYVKEVTAKTFMADVIQASQTVPVLLYFTASWCSPCKQFGPLLEKVVNDAKGKVRLAKVDVDKCPEIAQQLRIQSVPTVYVFLQGQPLDAFQGAIPESQLKQLIGQLLNAAPQHKAMVVSLEEAKKLLAEGKAVEALEQFSALLEQDEANIEAMAGSVAALTELGELDQAETVLAAVPQESANHEAVASVRTSLSLKRLAPDSRTLQLLQDKLTAHPDDHKTRAELAVALFSSGKQEEGIHELLHIISSNKDWEDGAARAQLLTFFEALGHTHPLTMQGRRKLSTILFA